MPEIEIHRNGLDPDWILAVMKYPSDEEMRRSYYALKFAERLLEDCGRVAEIEIRGELLEDLINAANKPALDELTADRTKRAYVAGDVLLCVYAMHSFPSDISEPSVRKAIFLAQELAGKTQYGDGSKMATSESAIRKYFDEFRSVAHLWAAMRLHESYPIRDHDEIFASAQAVDDFLGIAGTIQDFGSRFIPKRAKPSEPVLDIGDLWRVPDCATRLLPPWKSLPGWFLQTLKQYKPKQSPNSN